MTQQPDDSGTSNPQQGHRGPGEHDENWLTDYAEDLKERADEGEPRPLSEQSDGEATDISTDPMPPSGV